MYEKDRDGVEGIYPPAPINRQGQLVYAREGCAQCHTQMIRPTQLALDGWRKGWGQDQDPRPGAPVRSTTLLDYLGEPVAFLGVQRNGPDLANYGWRAPDRATIHQKLFAPRSLHSWSNMPPLKHLYIVRKEQGPESGRALKLTGKFAPEPGYEVVPTPEAEALVDYLLSLKKDYPIPGASPAVAAAAPAAAAKK
jgi:cytochrome c oxidase cbb3-type subunit 2